MAPRKYLRDPVPKRIQQAHGWARFESPRLSIGSRFWPTKNGELKSGRSQRLAASNGRGWGRGQPPESRLGLGSSPPYDMPSPLTTPLGRQALRNGSIGSTTPRQRGAESPGPNGDKNGSAAPRDSRDIYNLAILPFAGSILRRVEPLRASPPPRPQALLADFLKQGESKLQEDASKADNLG